MYVRRATSLLLLFTLVYVTIRLLFRNEGEGLSNYDSVLPGPGHAFHVTNPPSPGVVDFWHKWVYVFEEAQPLIPPIKVQTQASTADGLIPDDDARAPTLTSLGLSQDSIESMRLSHAILLDHPDFSKTQDEAGKLFKGTGIVTVAGGWYYGPALISIRMLRKTNSTLPVQVFLQSSSEYEPFICEEVLPALNAECFVIEDYMREDIPLKVTHYQLKVLAILFSSFDDVLFLDSDCIPLHDPSLLLSSEPYTTFGFVSWPDYWIATEDPAFYTIAGFPEFPSGLPLRSSEAGQLMISKRRHLPSLLLAAYYNVFGPTHYYPLLAQGAPGEGDKDTFLAAVIVLNESFYRVQTKTGTVGVKDHQGGNHNKGMIQYDAMEEYSLREFVDHAKPRPFFLHANLAKMNVARLLEKDDLFMPFTGQAKERTRLWGTQERILRVFDYDIEKAVWVEMVDMACTLGTILNDFKKRKNVCKGAKTHWNEVFAENETEKYA